jgi:hypothetical protein
MLSRLLNIKQVYDTINIRENVYNLQTKRKKHTIKNDLPLTKIAKNPHFVNSTIN